MQEAAELAPGAMAAILGLGADAIRTVTADAAGAGRVQLANFNAPTQIVISGDRSAVALASELAVAAGARKAIPLNVSGAWHSALMEPARTRFARSIAQAPLALPAFTVVSNVDAEPYRDVATMRTNLIRSVTDEVLWHAAAERLLEERLDLVVECGGTAVLTGLVRRLPGAPKTLHVGDENGIAKLAELVSSGAAVS
jgi:[acyl-carrier-protein] S-malonyltransferase